MRGRVPNTALGEKPSFTVNVSSAAQHYSIFTQYHLRGQLPFESTREPQVKKNMVVSAEVSV